MAKKNLDLVSGELWPAQSLGEWQVRPRAAFEAWLASLIVGLARQLRPTAQATYRGFFSAWCQHLEKTRCGVLEATAADAAAFFATQGLDPVSRRRYLLFLDRMYRALGAMGWNGVNPMTLERQKERKLAEKEPEYLSEGEVADLWQALQTLPGWKGLRDRAALALMLGAGLRSGEVVALRWDAVAADFQVTVRQSADGVQPEHVTLLLPGAAREHWLAWESQYRELGVVTQLAIPSAKAGKAFSPSGIFRRIDAWLALADLEREERGANLLRNTFARLALTRYPPEIVQGYLGHAELRATLRHLPEPLL